MFRCKGCEARDKEIAYLQQLVDALLEKLSVSPVSTNRVFNDSLPEDDDDLLLGGGDREIVGG